VKQRKLKRKFKELRSSAIDPESDASAAQIGLSERYSRSENSDVSAPSLRIGLIQ
jgi:hypothetical protein